MWTWLGWFGFIAALVVLCWFAVRLIKQAQASEAGQRPEPWKPGQLGPTRRSPWVSLRTEVTLLIDGLGHGLSRPEKLANAVCNVLDSVQWRGRLIWVSGQPYAFDKCWGRFAWSNYGARFPHWAGTLAP